MKRLAILLFALAQIGQSQAQSDSIAPAADKANADVTALHRFSGCIEPAPDRRETGNRAFISDDGTALVLQCGDGTVRSWQAQQEQTVAGKPTLISVARDLRLIPEKVVCTDFSGFAPEFSTLAPELDCDIADHDLDWSNYIVTDKVSGTYTLVNSSLTMPKHLMVETGALLFPRSGQAHSIMMEKSGPATGKTFALRGIADGALDPSPAITIKDSIFRKRDTGAFRLLYSDANKLFLVECQGVLTYCGDVADSAEAMRADGIINFSGQHVAIIRAYGPDGSLRWTIKRSLSGADSQSGKDTGFPHTMVLFDHGRYAALGTSSDFGTFDLLDLASGQELAAMKGQVIAASANARRLLVRHSASELSLVDVGH